MFCVKQTTSTYLYQIMPLIFAYIMSLVFYLTWCALAKHVGYLEIEIFDFDIDARLFPGRIIFAKYLTAAILLALIVTELVVILYSVYSVRNKRTFANEFNFCCNFLVPSTGFCILLFLSFLFLNTYFTPLINPINAIGREWFVCFLGKGLFDLLEFCLVVTYLLTLITISAAIGAASTLDPKLAWNIPSKKKRSKSAIQTAIDEITWQVRWMKYYLCMAAAFLVIGILCIKAWTSLPLAYLEPKGMAANAFRETANAIVVNYAVFFVLLLVVVFVPVCMRLLRSAAHICEISLPSTSESDRRRWLAQNGLTLSVAETAQGVIAILSPVAIPIVQILI